MIHQLAGPAKSILIGQPSPGTMLHRAHVPSAQIIAGSDNRKGCEEPIPALQRGPRLPMTEGRGQGQSVPTIVHEALRTPAQPLDAHTQTSMRSLMGYDFSRVHVHTGTLAGRSARSLQASAYTLGSDIVFAAGAYAPDTAKGRRLLAHELTHVIQQGRSGKRIQRWKGPVHEGVTQLAAERVFTDDEDVIPIAQGRSQFVAALKRYSGAMDWKGGRLVWSLPLFFSGAVPGEGPDHGEDGNYQSEDIEGARRQNIARQRQYIEESVRYYQQFVLSGQGEQSNRGGPGISSRDPRGALSAPLFGAVGGAIAGPMFGYGLAKRVSEKVGGGFWGGLLGALTGLVTVPLGLAAGAALGGLGLFGIISAVKSRPATNAQEGVLAALGDACHVAQDRAAHWEGVKGFGHADPRPGWNPDDKKLNNNAVNSQYFGSKKQTSGIFGGFEIAVENTVEVLQTWKSLVRRYRGLGRPEPR